MSLFPKPSAIIQRLRAVRDYYIAKPVTGFPTFEVFGAASQDLAERSAQENTPISLYVMNGSSSGSVTNHSGIYPTDITSGYYIVLVVRMDDFRGQKADEWTTFFREFCIKALHGWDPFTTPSIPGQASPALPSNNPLTFASDTPVNIPGYAYIRRTFEFNHEVEIARDDLNGTLGSWDDLEWFEELRETMLVTAPTGGDEIEFPVNVDIIQGD